MLRASEVRWAVSNHSRFVMKTSKRFFYELSSLVLSGCKARRMSAKESFTVGAITDIPPVHHLLLIR